MSASTSQLRVFVTGATGVLGRRVVPLLLRDGHQVSALARTPEQRASLAALGVATSDAQLFDRDSLVRALDEAQVVLNLATHIPTSSFRMMLRSSWRENDRIRREGSANILHAAQTARVETYIQESFAPIYEDGGSNWIDETSTVRPVAYNQTVLAAEASANQFSASGGRGIVLRFGWFYGPDSFHVHDFVRMVRMGFAPVPGAAKAYWSSVSHDDAAAAVVAALGAPAGTYNVVDDQPLPRREFCDALADAFSLRHPRLLPPVLTKLMGDAGELLSRSQRMTNRKFHKATSWSPRDISAREGFRAIAAAWSAGVPVRRT